MGTISSLGAKRNTDSPMNLAEGKPKRQRRSTAKAVAMQESQARKRNSRLSNSAAVSEPTQGRKKTGIQGVGVFSVAKKPTTRSRATVCDTPLTTNTPPNIPAPSSVPMDSWPLYQQQEDALPFQIINRATPQENTAQSDSFYSIKSTLNPDSADRVSGSAVSDSVPAQAPVKPTNSIEQQTQNALTQTPATMMPESTETAQSDVSLLLGKNNLEKQTMQEYADLHSRFKGMLWSFSVTF